MQPLVRQHDDLHLPEWIEVIMESEIDESPEEGHAAANQLPL